MSQRSHHYRFSRGPRSSRRSGEGPRSDQLSDQFGLMTLDDGGYPRHRETDEYLRRSHTTPVGSSSSRSHRGESQYRDHSSYWGDRRDREEATLDAIGSVEDGQTDMPKSSQGQESHRDHSNEKHRHYNHQTRSPSPPHRSIRSHKHRIIEPRPSTEPVRYGREYNCSRDSKDVSRSPSPTKSFETPHRNHKGHGRRTKSPSPLDRTHLSQAYPATKSRPSTQPKRYGEEYHSSPGPGRSKDLPYDPSEFNIEGQYEYLQAERPTDMQERLDSLVSTLYGVYLTGMPGKYQAFYYYNFEEEMQRLCGRLWSWKYAISTQKLAIFFRKRRHAEETADMLNGKPELTELGVRAFVGKKHLGAGSDVSDANGESDVSGRSEEGRGKGKEKEKMP